MPEERLKLNRERNRDHSRRSRERKKALVEGLKKQVGGPSRLTAWLALLGVAYRSVA